MTPPKPKTTPAQAKTAKTKHQRRCPLHLRTGAIGRRARAQSALRRGFKRRSSGRRSSGSRDQRGSGSSNSEGTSRRCRKSNAAAVTARS
uniref:Uncharacterized protein n=1 Tax=Rhizophora mucronata TaxID=61149 RepID=A0A2P2LR01_RHIMU